MSETEMVVVSPDLGGVSRARAIATRLNCSIAIIDKRRPEPGVAEVMNLIGSVDGKIAIMVDDIVDTAGSLTEGAKALKKFGAKEINACCTHVLQQFSTFERENIQEAITKAADALEMWIQGDMDKVMQEFNKKPAKSEALEKKTSKNRVLP